MCALVLLNSSFQSRGEGSLDPDVSKKRWSASEAVLSAASSEVWEHRQGVMRGTPAVSPPDKSTRLPRTWNKITASESFSTDLTRTSTGVLLWDSRSHWRQQESTHFSLRWGAAKHPFFSDEDMLVDISAYFVHKVHHLNKSWKRCKLCS